MMKSNQNILFSEFESKLEKNRNNYERSLPFLTMVPIYSSTAGRWRMERAPKRENIEQRKSAKLIFVLMCVINSKYEITFLLLILKANVCMVWILTDRLFLYMQRLTDMGWLLNLEHPLFVFQLHAKLLVIV